MPNSSLEFPDIGIHLVGLNLKETLDAEDKAVYSELLVNTIIEEIESFHSENDNNSTTATLRNLEEEDHNVP